MVKLLSDTPVYSAKHGIYSHRYHASDDRPLWLVGGASNSGCRILSQLFTQTQLDAMTTQLQPEKPTGLQYYPLPSDSIGERFPIADATQEAEITPRPDDDVEYFQGLLESISRIEQQSYALLQQLGAGKVKRLFTAGGGSRNAAWNTIRHDILNIPVSRASHTEASYGAALLARRHTQP